MNVSKSREDGGLVDIEASAHLPAAWNGLGRRLLAWHEQLASMKLRGRMLFEQRHQPGPCARVASQQQGFQRGACRVPGHAQRTAVLTALVGIAEHVLL